MKRNDKVQVKQQCNQTEFRGKTGTVIADNSPGDLVDVDLDDEAVTHSFNEKDLELI